MVDYGGGVACEQVALSKKSLSANVYNHQKVTAAHAMVRDLIKMIIRGEADVNGKKYDNPASFWAVTDWDICAGTTNSEKGQVLQKKIAGRILPRRALGIAHHTMENEDSKKNLALFFQQMRKEQENENDGLRNKIAEVADLEPLNVYVSVSKIPSFHEMLEGKCRYPGGDIGEIYERFHKGTDVYGLRRDISYIYALDCEQEKVAEAAKEVLGSDEYGPLTFNGTATASFEG